MSNILNSQNIDPSKNKAEIGLKGVFNPIFGAKMEETLRNIISQMEVSMFQNVERQITSTIGKKEQKPVMKFDASSIGDKYYKKVNNLAEEIRRIENVEKLEKSQEVRIQESESVIPIGTKIGMALSNQTIQRAVNSKNAITLGINSYYKRVYSLDIAIKEFEIGKKPTLVVTQSSSGVNDKGMKTTAQIVQYDSAVKEREKLNTEQIESKSNNVEQETKSKLPKIVRLPKIKKRKAEKAKQPKAKKEKAEKPEKVKQPKVKKEKVEKPEKVKRPKVKKEKDEKPEKVKQPKDEKKKRQNIASENEKRIIKKAETIEDPNRLTEPKRRNILKRIILQMKYDTGKYEFIEDGYQKGDITREELEFYKNSQDREDRKYYKEVQEYEDITKDVAVSRGWATFKLGLATMLLAGTLAISNNVIQEVKDSIQTTENEKTEITLENTSQEELNMVKQKIALIKKSSNYNFENLEENEQLLAFLKIKDIEKDISVRSFQGEFLRCKDQEFLLEILETALGDEYLDYSDVEKVDLKKLVFELLPEEKKQYVRDPQVLIEIERDKEEKIVEQDERN